MGLRALLFVALDLAKPALCHPLGAIEPACLLHGTPRLAAVCNQYGGRKRGVGDRHRDRRARAPCYGHLTVTIGC